MRFVFVEPKYSLNFGYSLRVLKNFGFSEIYVVNPRFSLKSKTLVKFSKHAKDLIKKVKQAKSLEDAVEGVVVATTAVKEKAKHRYYNIITPEGLCRIIKGGKKVSIVIGRDDTGLTPEEIGKMDYVLTIPANPEYPTLNLSHALAIIAYFAFICSDRHLNSKNKKGGREKGKERIIKIFENHAEKLLEGTSIRDKEKVKNAFISILKRSDATDLELKAVLAWLKKLGPKAGWQK